MNLYSNHPPTFFLVTQVLEINPRHPFITKLLEGSPPETEEEDAEPFVVSQETKDAAWLLFDMASLNGGFDIADVKAHSQRMTTYMQSTLLKADSLDLEAEIDPPEEDEEAPDDVDMEDMMAGMNMADFDMDNLDLDGM